MLFRYFAWKCLFGFWMTVLVAMGSKKPKLPKVGAVMNSQQNPKSEKYP
jgi:hypothetical protein